MKLVCSDHALLKDLTRDLTQEVSLSEHDSHDDMIQSYYALQAKVKSEERPVSASRSKSNGLLCVSQERLHSSASKPRKQQIVEP